MNPKRDPLKKFIPWLIAGGLALVLVNSVDQFKQYKNKQHAAEPAAGQKGGK